MQAKELMTGKVQCVAPDTKIPDAAKQMKGTGCGIFARL